MEFKVGIIGLGYVGLPLAVEAGKKYSTVGFDIKADRIYELTQGQDRTREVSSAELGQASHLAFSSEPNDLSNCNFYIVTVPTPVDAFKKPDLAPLREACKTVSEVLKKGDIVVFESTVFPGCTEDICVPLLEEGSGLVFNNDFFCGYSPERINPADKKHRLTTILKVTSGSTQEAATTVDQFYKSLIPAGTHLTSSIRVAEAAKVIENAQRDINIAFINELAIIFQMMGLDTQEVLEAAGTKWNFLPFRPGLVGGHCIGVDPYYLTYKAESLGYHPRVILAGRDINDGMGAFVAQQVIKILASKRLLNQDIRMLILGITFKENCPDVRNTKVIDIYHALDSYNFQVDIYDPEASPEEVNDEYQLSLIEEPVVGEYDVVISAVAHDVFKTYDWESIRKKVSVIFDVKTVVPVHLTDSRL